MHSPGRAVRRLIALVVSFAVVAVACGADDPAESGAPTISEDTAGEAEPSDEVEDPAAGYISEIYADAEFWHCRPDLADDVCSAGFDATEVAADGSQTEVPFEPAEDPSFDCFYVYPTLDFSPTPGNHPFEVDNPIEPLTVRGQAARFGELCRMFVPRYRQATIGSYDAAVDGDIFAVPAFETAYADVLDAFNQYMANDNDGRPLVLLGHSQGSHHLVRLLEEEFDNSESRREQLISALLIGPTGRMRVPEGELVGGTFENLPLCASEDETGCVVAFDSFAEERPPEVGTGGDGLAPACVNPANVGGGVDSLAGGYFGTTVEGVGTPFELIEDYYTADCTLSENGLPYLEIAATPAPGDRRDLNHIESHLSQAESLHSLDYNFALGDLLALVQSQAAAYGL